MVFVPLIPTGFIELGKKDYDGAHFAGGEHQPDQFPAALPLDNRLMLNCLGHNILGVNS